MSVSFIKYDASIEDPLIDRYKRHELKHVQFIGLHRLFLQFKMTSW